LFETGLQEISKALSTVKHTVDVITSQGFIETHLKIREASLRKQSSVDYAEDVSRNSFSKPEDRPILILKQVQSQDSSLLVVSESKKRDQSLSESRRDSAKVDFKDKVGVIQCDLADLEEFSKNEAHVL